MNTRDSGRHRVVFRAPLPANPARHTAEPHPKARETMDPNPPSFPLTPRNRVRRRPQRGHYDHETVYRILDAAMLCHIAYVIDGQPYCTPTAFWREGDHLYWHGSSASRMLRAEATGIPVCLTVSHMDAIVLARCGFNHSINYRAVMAFGRAAPIEGAAAKKRAMDGFIDRFFPGRAGALRAPTAKEIKATMLVGMRIEDASAKIRDVGVHDDEEDYAHPVWTALVPLQTVLGASEECPRQLPGLDAASGGMAAYRAGRRLDAVMTETAAAYARRGGAVKD